MTILKIIIAIVLAALIAAGAFGYWVYSSVNSAHAHARANDYIKIEKGLSPKDIITKLVAEGIIEKSAPTLVYLRLVGDPGNLQAGEFQFPSPITPLQVLKVLEKGEDRMVKFTVP